MLRIHSFSVVYVKSDWKTSLRNSYAFSQKNLKNMLSFLDIEICKHPRGPIEKLCDYFLESLFGKSDSIHFF